MDLLGWQLSIVGCSVRAKDASYKARVVERIKGEVWPLVSARRIVAKVQAVVAMDRLPEAVALLITREANGKIVCINDS